jgi:predicted nucleic acid-binding protein
VDELRKRLTKHSIVGIDTAVFIYHLEVNQRYQQASRVVLDMVERGAIAAVTSVLTLMEITALPWREHRPSVARRYEALLVNFPHLEIADVTRAIARQAARLRAEYNLRPADALQIATALQLGGTALVTNDRQLRRLVGLLDVVLLDEYASVSGDDSSAL